MSTKNIIKMSATEHHGERLRALTRAKGFNMRELSEEFGITRAAIEKHFKSEKLTRKVVKQYADKFGFSLDTFFEGSEISLPEKVTEKGGTVPAHIHSELQSRYFDLQSRYDELVKRFFPSAVNRLVTNY